MTDDNMKSENNESPMDDAGINNDHILDLCDFIITSAWTKYIGNSIEQVSIQELKDLAFTLGSVWGLAQDILDIDRRLRSLDEGPEDEFPSDYMDDI